MLGHTRLGSIRHYLGEIRLGLAKVKFDWETLGQLRLGWINQLTECFLAEENKISGGSKAT